MAAVLASSLIAFTSFLSMGCHKPVLEAPADSKRVLVVINKASEDSRTVGEYYMAKRRIPKANLCTIDCSMSENISGDEFKNQILIPVQRAIDGSSNPIDFIVLTKGVPIRIRDDNGFSVDGHLVAMKLNMPEIEHPIPAEIKKCINPYFNRNEHFSSARYKMYLVTRLDAYDVPGCKALVDHALQARAEKGLFFFDAAANRKEGDYLAIQQGLYRANQILKTKELQAKLDEKPEFVAPIEPLAGYASWGSNDAAYSVGTYRKLKFKNGALAETFVSTSARTFKRTQDGQSLIADLIENGVTGVKGYVSEPFTFALAKPDILFDHYTSGFNLAESFYAASLVINWKDVVIGDPLCNPYEKSDL